MGFKFGSLGYAREKSLLVFDQTKFLDLKILAKDIDITIFCGLLAKVNFDKVKNEFWLEYLDGSTARLVLSDGHVESKEITSPTKTEEEEIKGSFTHVCLHHVLFGETLVPEEMKHFFSNSKLENKVHSEMKERLEVFQETILFGVNLTLA
jgi:hypothetical protein